MSVKRLFILVLAVLMLFLSACGDSEVTSSLVQSGQNPTSGENVPDSLQLLYCENDTLNPYNTVSKVNAEIGQLLFEPLVVCDDNFEASFALASSVTVEETTCTVNLRSARFSDGAMITADDVIFSYNLAKESERFSYLFYNVLKAEAKDSRTVVFTLEKSDPYFYKLLTFPILKTGSDELKNEDNVELAPIGGGRFVQSKENSALLVPNDYYYGETSTVTGITLINAPDSESVEHYVEIGATDIYYTNLSDDSIIRMSGKKTSVNLNNFIYIGINHNYSLLRNEKLRFALSAAIDRNELIKTAYYGNAKAATGFFHPDWVEVSGYQTVADAANEKIVIENLEEIGYNSLDRDGIRITSSGTKLALNLLVNNESASKTALANAVKSQLEKLGIKINIQAVSSDAYFSALKSGSFQLYIGEVKLLPNMDISSLVMPDGSAAYGILKDTEASDEDTAAGNNYIDMIEGFYNGENTIADVATSLLASMPVIPVAYRNGLVFYSDTIEELSEVSAFDLFADF